MFILVDKIEAFRQTSLKHYKLDLAHYYSAPGLSWDAMLKYKRVKLELLTDPDILYFFLKVIRGGLSVIIKRYIKANKKYMKNYDPNQASLFITPEDANNIYGAGMSLNYLIEIFILEYV